MTMCEQQCGAVATVYAVDRDPGGWGGRYCEPCATALRFQILDRLDGLCHQPVRGGGECTLSAGHRGYHSTVTFGCDACGKRRRGVPAAYGRDGEHERGLAVCFLCVMEYARSPVYYE